MQALVPDYFSRHQQCAPEGTGPTFDYQLTGLPHGDYQIRFESPSHLNLVSEYHPGTTDPDTAELLTIDTATPDHTGIDADLEVGRTISGTIHHVGGIAHNLCAWAQPLTWDPDLPGPPTSARTCINPGESDEPVPYTLGGLQPADYLITFTASTNQGTIEEYYDNVATYDLATLVTIPTTGPDPTTINATLGAPTVPGAPTDVVAVAADGAATVSWTPPRSGGSPITSYVVAASPGGHSVTVSGSATAATLTGLQNGASYTFTVTAHNSLGAGPPSPPSNAVRPPGTTDPDVVPPALAGAVQVAPDSVDVTDGPATVEVSVPLTDDRSGIWYAYAVFRSPSGNQWAEVQFYDPTSGNDLDGTYTNQLTLPHHAEPGPWRLSSFATTDWVGNTLQISRGFTTPFPTELDVTINVTSGEPLTAPTAVTATPGDGTVLVEWSPPASSGGSAIERYRVVRQPGGEAIDVSADQTHLQVAGLANGVTYTFVVEVENAAGAVAVSAPTGGVIPLSPDGVQETVSAGASVATGGGSAPSAEHPVITSVTTPNAGQVAIDYNAPHSGPAGYDVLGQSVGISAPPATADDPLQLRFAVAGALVGPRDPQEVTISRNGVLVAECTHPTNAVPDPCVASRDVVAGDLVLVVHTSTASVWQVVAPTDADTVPPGGGPGGAGGGGGLPPPAEPTVSIGDVEVPEGEIAQLVVTLDTPATSDVQVVYATEDHTAQESQDYLATEGRLLIPRGDQSGVIEVTTLADDDVEGDEDFVVTLSEPVGAVLGRAAAHVTILDGTDVPTPGTTTIIPLPETEADNSSLSIAFSQLSHPEPSTFAQAGGEVLLASETVFADALSSGALQGDRPLLLTDPTRLEAPVLAEIQRLGVGTVRILGGDQAVGPEVEQALLAAGLQVTRTAGATRLETAVEIARLAMSADDAFLARAYPSSDSSDPTQAFADTLALGAWAAAARTPILLTQTDVLSGPTAAWLEGADLASLRLIGGEAAIVGPVAEQAGVHAIHVTRVDGLTRFDTAVAMARARGFSAMAPAESVIVVEGQAPNSWAAGFSAAHLAALTDAPVLLANGEGLPPETAEFLADAIDDGASLVCVASESACRMAEELLDRSGGTARAH